MMIMMMMMKCHYLKHCYVQVSKIVLHLNGKKAKKVPASNDWEEVTANIRAYFSSLARNFLARRKRDRGNDP